MTDLEGGYFILGLNGHPVYYLFITTTTTTSSTGCRASTSTTMYTSLNNEIKFHLISLFINIYKYFTSKGAIADFELNLASNVSSVKGS